MWAESLTDHLKLITLAFPQIIVKSASLFQMTRFLHCLKQIVHTYFQCNNDYIFYFVKSQNYELHIHVEFTGQVALAKLQSR